MATAEFIRNLTSYIQVNQKYAYQIQTLFNFLLLSYKTFCV